MKHTLTIIMLTITPATTTTAQPHTAPTTTTITAHQPATITDDTPDDTITADTAPTTLAQCRALALAHNRTLATARLKLQQATHDMKSYKANHYPQINLMATDFYSTAQGHITIDGGQLPIYKYSPAHNQHIPDITLHPDGTYTLNQYADFPPQQIDWKLKNIFTGGISLTEPLYAGGKITAAYKMSKLGIQIATDNIRLTEEETILHTDEAYYTLLHTQELRKVAQAYKTLLDELMKNIQAAQHHGMRTHNDAMKVQVKLNEATLAIQKADNAHQLATMHLCHIIGLPLNTPIQATTPPDQDHTTTLTNTTTPLTITTRPEHAILQHKTELTRHNIHLTQSDHLPHIALAATYTYTNGAELAGKPLLDNASLTAGITLTMPLDLFGTTTNKTRSARAAHQIAQLEQQDLTEQMQLELQQNINLANEAQTELNLAHTALTQAQENLRLSRQQYDLGLETLSDHLEAQAQWQQCSANLANARCQLNLAHTRLLKAAGQLR